MSARAALLAIGLTLSAAGTAAAKPPGLPADPHADGKERTPVEREYHTTARTESPLGFVTTWPAGRAPMTPAEAEAWRALNRLPAALLGLALPRAEWY
jgi:hypothetical protein